MFKADFNVTAGTQYNRTASVWLGGVNIYFGTTQEPRSTVSPSWHVERDVTDLSPLFRTGQAANAIVYNVYDETYNGSITGSDGSAYQAATVDQRLDEHDNDKPAHAANYFDSVDYHDTAADTLTFDPSGNFIGPTGQQATQSYLSRDSYARCYSRSVDAASGAVTVVNGDAGCP